MSNRIVRIILRGETAGVTGPLKSLSSSLAQTARDFDQVEGRAKRTDRSMFALGRTVAGTAAALGLGKLVKDSIDLEAAYSKTMAQVAVATDAPKAALADLDDLAMKLGADTVFSAQDAAQAMLELAKGGLSTAQIEAGALADTLTLASAGGLELGDAANTVVQAMGAFKLEAKDTGGAVAALAGAANASSADVSDITQALAQAGTSAASAGLSIQDTTAFLGLFADSGIQGSDAGTSLRTMLTRLVPQTKEASKAMDALGLSYLDGNGQLVNAEEIVKRTQKAFSGLTDEQKISAANTIFGADAQRAVNVLTAEGVDGFKKYKKATSDLTQAQKLAEAANSGTAGAMENLSGQIETAKIQIGKGLAPTVQELAGRIGDLVEGGDFEEWAATAGDAIVEFVDTVGPMAQSVLPALNMAAQTTGDVLKVVAPLVKQLADAFNSLPESAQTAILLGAGGAYLGKKATAALGAVGAGVATSGGRTAAGAAGAAGGSAAAAATRGSAAGVVARTAAGRALGVVGIAGILGEIYDDKLLNSVQNEAEKARRGKPLSASEKVDQRRYSTEILGGSKRRSGGGQFADMKRDVLDLSNGVDAYIERLQEVPDKVITEVLEKGAEASEASVRQLSRAYEMTPDEVRTELAARDLASGKLQIVNGRLVDLNGKRAAVTVDANVAAARAAILGIYNFANSLPGISIPVGKGRANGGAILRAEGGSVLGPGTGTSDSIPAVGPGGAAYRLSNGEHVLTAREVDLIGGQNAVYAMRAAIRSQQFAFASGGAVGSGSGGSGGGGTFKASLVGAQIGFDRNGMARFVSGHIEVAMNERERFNDSNRRAGRG